MNEKEIVISLDCFGGDNSPLSVIEGMVIYLLKNKNENIKFLLCGDEYKIKQELKKYKNFESYYTIIHTDKKVDSNEKPSIAIRKGKDSSMGVAIECVKNNEADAVISAGNTGALMALSKLILRPLEGIDRPALIQLIPTEDNKSVALLDLGANIEVNSESLYQFAIMGSIFYEVLNNFENPQIGILNIGTEDIKGNDIIKNTALLLRESKLKDNFYGSIEGNNIFKNKVQVIVTDGFTGNIALKTIEGTVKFMVLNIKNMLKRTILSMIGSLFLFNSLKKFKQKINPENYNGALFIGLNGISVKSHGNADGKSFYFAIENTIKIVKGNINKKIIEILKEDLNQNDEEY